MGSITGRYNNGDVLVKPSWESSDFFLVHENVLSKRSTYFQTVFSGRWSKPHIADVDKEELQTWTLYFMPDAKDPRCPTFVLTARAPSQSEAEEAREEFDRVYDEGMYRDLLSEFRGRNGFVDYLLKVCSRHCCHLCSQCAGLAARSQAMEVHKCIFDLIYERSLEVPDMSRPELKVIFLADLIYYAHLYNVLDGASHKIEQVFLEIKDIEKYYRYSAKFFVQVGYYLQSEEIFLEAMKYMIGKVQADLSGPDLPDSVLELELEIRERFSSRMKVLVRRVMELLVFGESYERSYWNRHKRLNEAQLKTREVAKMSLRNWFTMKILLQFNEDFEEQLVPPAQNWRRFVSAITESKVGHLRDVDVGRLSKRYSIRQNTLKQAIEQELQRLGQDLHYSDSSDGDSPQFEMYPCEHDNCRNITDFWIDFRFGDGTGSPPLHLPWKVKGEKLTT